MKADRKKITKALLEPNAYVEDRIASGVEAHRKGFGEIRLTTASGEPVESATVTLRQTGHAFHFGCNAFLLDQFDSAEQNDAYEQRFANLFNMAVCPFYWSDLEPERGKPRFAVDSEPIYRRPPTDRCVEFCEAHGITPKGHPLAWQLFYPDWIPDDPTEARRLLIRRIETIAERYRDRIHHWDTCNEALVCRRDHPIRRLGDHVDLAFSVAERAFPESTRLYYNEVTWVSWGSNLDVHSPLYLLLQRLAERRRLGGIGLQYHIFRREVEELETSVADVLLNPENLLSVLDLYQRFGLPISVSEITIPAFDMVDDGEGFQAEVAERLYRLWFSHPAVGSIVWWNLVDGTAAFAPRNTLEGENFFRAGLVHYDMRPKKAYEVLERLIRSEWRTDCRVDYRAGGDNRFKGFYGTYDATIETASGTTETTLRFDAPAKRFDLTV